MTPVRIIAVGSDFGDDRLGFELLEHLRQGDLPADCSLHACANPATELLALLAGAELAVVVDAIDDGGPAGRVLCCAPADLAPRATRASTHGVSIDTVLALAAALGTLPPHVLLAGISIDPQHDVPAAGLSPAVQAALPALAAAVRDAVSLEMMR